jgi:uncharacterized repeat protein (TIGR03843 family)
MPRNLLTWLPCADGILDTLSRAEVRECRLLPYGSNYVFLAELWDSEAGTGLGIYKPRKGEAPLWDFPDGTLYRRERAAYLLASDLGWDFVPPTVVRDGPHGVGSMQLFIENDEQANFFTLRDSHVDELRRIALFDVLANNADRKGGHCLLANDAKIWGIDHGLTFHESYKLRTVIWDFSEESIPPSLVGDLEGFARRLVEGKEIAAGLGELLSRAELSALVARLEQLLERRRFPRPGLRRSVPWPPL